MKNKVILIVFLIFLFYLVFRDIIYTFYPVESHGEWAYRDIVMNIPRLLCLISIIFVQKWKKFESVAKVSTIGKKYTFYIGILLISLIPLRSLFVDTQRLQSDLIVWIIVGSFLVGFFEEGLFRGLFFDSLKQQNGTFVAVLFSTLLFSLFHIGVVPVNELPTIFLIGIIFALLRDKNVSLFMLSLLHAFYDGFIMFWLPVSSLTPLWITIEMLCLGIIAICFYLWTEKDCFRNWNSRLNHAKNCFIKSK